MAHPSLDALAARQQAKKHRTKTLVKAGGILTPIGNSKNLPPAFAKKIEVGTDLAWFKLCSGIGTVDNYNEVAWAANVVEFGLRDQGIPEVTEVVLEANAALDEMRLHFLDKQEWVATDRAKAIVPSLLDLLTQLLQFLSINQLERILKEIERERVKHD